MQGKPNPAGSGIAPDFSMLRMFQILIQYCIRRITVSSFEATMSLPYARVNQGILSMTAF
jgi:hypothetical protein